MIYWTDYFSNAKVGDFQLLGAAEVDPAKHLLLTTSAQTLTQAAWPELVAMNLWPTNSWQQDGTALRSNGGYYMSAHGGGELGVFEVTPGLGSGKLRAISYGGIWESIDRGATWTFTTKSSGWLVPSPWSPQSVPSAIMQDTNGDLYHCWAYNDYDGDTFYHKGVMRSTNHGDTWTQLWSPEASDGGSNQYNDIAIGTIAGGQKRMVVTQFNGRIITSDWNGSAWSSWTQRRAGSGGSAPFNYSARWVQQFNGGNGMFVVAGGDRLYTSPDGITWTQFMLPAGHQVYALSDYGPLGVIGYSPNSSSVGTSGNQKPVQSTDGVTWVTCPLDIPINSTVNPTQASTLMCLQTNHDRTTYHLLYKHPNGGTAPQHAITTNFTTWDSYQLTSANENYFYLKVFPDCVMYSPGYSLSNQNYNVAGYQLGRAVKRPSPTFSMTLTVNSSMQSLVPGRQWYLRGAS